MIYFDSAATTLQKPAAVAQAVAKAINTVTTPGRGDHPAARQAAELMLSCRTEAAELFHTAEPDSVVFTSNATHGLNIAIKSLVSPGDTVVISGYEHNAVTRPLTAIGGVTVRVVNGRLFDPAQMVEGFSVALREKVKAVICTHVSNVYGYALPIEEIAQLCRQRGIPLVVDASQSAGILPVDVEGWKAAYVAMPGHKGLYGPQGTGLLLCGAGQQPKALLEGGTGSLSRQQDMPDFLPDRLEAGTHNVHGVAGLLEGMRFVRKQGVETIARREAALIEALSAGMMRLGKFRVFHRRGIDSSVLSAVPMGVDPEELAAWMAEKGVALRAGLHCAPLAHMTGGTLDTGTVRFSVSAFNTMAEVEQVLRLLKSRMEGRT